MISFIYHGLMEKCLYIIPSFSTQSSKLFYFVDMVSLKVLQFFLTTSKKAYQIQINNSIRQLISFIKYNQYRSMSKYQIYLSLIGDFSSKLIQHLTQYGLNTSEVNHHINSLIIYSFSMDYSASDIRTDQLITLLIRNNSKNIDKVMLKIIECLDRQVHSLCDEGEDQCIQNNTTVTKQQKVEVNNRFDFYLGEEEENVQTQPVQLCTPKGNSKFSRLREYYKETDVTNDLDVIQKSIQETLERTRKLRMLLDFKARQTRQKKHRFSPSAEDYEQIFNE